MFVVKDKQVNRRSIIIYNVTQNTDCGRFCLLQEASYDETGQIEAGISARTIQQEEEVLEEDPRLLNWKKWLEERKKLHRYFKKKLNRNPQSLVMNSFEKIRSEIEDKEVIEYTRIPAPPDHFRGGPGFWIPPVLLSNRGNPNLPDCSAVRTRKLRGLIPTIDYVGIPTAIEIEKDLYCESDCGRERNTWHKSEYLKKRRKELEEQIKYVEPHKPDMEELIIQNKYYSSNNRTSVTNQTVPVITVSPWFETMEELADEDLTNEFLVRETEKENIPSVCLCINGTKLWYAPCSALTSKGKDGGYNSSGPVSWSLTFNANVNETCERTITFENQGSVSIFYSWKKDDLTREIDLNLPGKYRSSSHFYFKKKDDIFLPGERTNIPILFRSQNPGVFQEAWELRTLPRLVNEDQRITFKLWGMVIKDVHGSSRADEIDFYLKFRQRQGTLLSVMRNIRSNISPVKAPEPPYRSLYLEDEVFQHVNPGYYYHPSIVENLKTLFIEATDGEDSAGWDLKLKTLRKVILEQTSSVKQQECLEKLSNFARTLQHPCIMSATEKRKHSTAYNIMCQFVNSIEREAETLKLQYGLVSSSTTVTPPHTQEKNGKMSSRDTKSSKPSTPSRRSIHNSDKAKSKASKKAIGRHISSASISDIGALQDHPEVPISQPVSPVDPKKREEYLTELLSKVYHHLEETVLQIAAAVESVNYLEK